MINFADRLFEAVERKRSHVVLGLDPDFDLLPPDVRALVPDGVSAGAEAVAECFHSFLSDLLGALSDVVVAVKPQLAYFEALGSTGYRLYEEMVAEARSLGYLVIADAKRGDIGSTAEAYARAHLDVVGADAVTVNPWFGTDGMKPFLRRAREDGKGLFVLVKTSNPSSAEIQDLVTETGDLVHDRVAELVLRWSEGTYGVAGYSSVGAVVGGTHPGQAQMLRAKLPGIPLLVPGYGAQGATADDIGELFDASGTGAVVNSSRAILYAHRARGGHWLSAARAEAEHMRAALWAVGSPGR